MGLNSPIHTEPLWISAFRSEWRGGQHHLYARRLPGFLSTHLSQGPLSGKGPVRKQLPCLHSNFPSRSTQVEGYLGYLLTSQGVGHSPPPLPAFPAVTDESPSQAPLEACGKGRLVPLGPRPSPGW